MYAERPGRLENLSELFGELENEVLEENGRDKMARERAGLSLQIYVTKRLLKLFCLPE